METLVAKPANSQDSKDISSIHAYCWRETYCFMPEEVLTNRGEKYRKNQWDSWFEQKKPTEALYKVVAGEKIVGFCFCKENEDDDLPEARGELHAAYILPEFRGGIVGPLMMKTMVTFLQKQNQCPVSLWAFRQNKVRYWYAQLGFKRMVERDRVIFGHAIPEFGYVHPDPDNLIDHMEFLISRGSLS